MEKKLQKAIVVLIIFSVFLSTVSFASNPERDYPNIDLSGESIFLVDYDSERILFDKNSSKKMYPASTTKIMTAILAIELGNMDDIVQIDDEVIHLTEGSHIALDYDEKMRFEDLLHGLVVASANDSALAIAKHISGSIDEFVGLMNKKAKELGALDTHFANPNGLHSENHYTTAHDLFLISKYAMGNQTFRTLVSKAKYTIPATNKKSDERLLHTTNRFLYGNSTMEINGKHIPIKFDGIKGIKTGTTPEAKNCLVSYAERDGKKIISVVLKSQGRKVYSDTYKLMEYGFDNFNPIFLGHSNEFVENIDIENGSLPYASAVLKDDIPYIVKDNEENNIEKKLKIRDDIELPIVKGDTLGNVEYSLEGNLIASSSIVSTVDISPVKKNALLQIFSLTSLKINWKKIILSLFIIFLSLTILNKFFRLKKRKSRKKNRFIRY